MQRFTDLLNKLNFGKQLKKLTKKYKDKKILLYGAGLFFETIHKNYDLGCLNIVGICDKNKTSGDVESLYGYPAVRPEKIPEISPEIILVAVIDPICLIESLKTEYHTTNIVPLVNKGRLGFLREILKI